MSNMINVDGSDDPAYRYKMPKLVSKVEGKGNGVKTVLMNCSEIAAALYRSTGQVCKYFGCELGAMTNYDEVVDKALVNGAFDNQILQEALTGYIKRFVLCPSCNNPETVQEIKGKKKSAIIMLKCKACGALGEADNTHKLITYIVKEKSSDTGNLSKKEKRKQRRNERNKKKVDEEKTVSSVSDEESKEKKRKKKKRHKDKDKDKESKHSKDGKKKKKKKDKKKKKKEETIKDSSEEKGSESDAESEADSITQNLGELTVHDMAILDSVVENFTAALGTSIDYETVWNNLEEQQKNSGLRRAEMIPIFLYSLLLTQIPLNMVFSLLQIFPKIVKSVRNSFLTENEIEVSILLSWEEGIARIEDENKRERALSLVPAFLKSFYEEDIIEETTLLQWYNFKMDEKKYKHVRCLVDEELLAKIRNNARPIIEWLETADSDSEDSKSDS